MDELLTVAPLAHYPWYCQLRLADYYSRMLDVSVRIHLESDIAGEDIPFIDLAIAIVFRNLVNIFRKDAGAPRCKDQPMAVADTGSIASSDSMRKSCAHSMNRILEH